MINWRSIKEVGYPTNNNKKYLVTDGKDISTTDISIRMRFKDNTPPEYTFIEWSGDDNTYEENSCCSGTKVFDMKPTHWCPTDELNLPHNIAGNISQLSDDKINNLICELDKYATNYDCLEYGLPTHGEHIENMRILVKQFLISYI